MGGNNKVARNNDGFLEELRRGNIRRECVEEVCSQEELHETKWYRRGEKKTKFKLDKIWEKDQNKCKNKCSARGTKNIRTIGHFQVKCYCECKRNFVGNDCKKEKPRRKDNSKNFPIIRSDRNNCDCNAAGTETTVVKEKCSCKCKSEWSGLSCQKPRQNKITE